LTFVAAMIALGTFFFMELVAALTHRYVMHGRAMVWHRSHHVPDGRRFQRNDLFPLIASTAAIASFAIGSSTPWRAFFWIGVGMTAYGIAYLFVHEVFIHERVHVPVPRLRYLERLRRAHRAHHLFGREPYGFVIPVVRDEMLTRADGVTRDPFAAAAR
jgi:beta-carotene 3-hydroxylase